MERCNATDRLEVGRDVSDFSTMDYERVLLAAADCVDISKKTSSFRAAGRSSVAFPWFLSDFRPP